jgi:hypothetical protein
MALFRFCAALRFSVVRTISRGKEYLRLGGNTSVEEQLTHTLLGITVWVSMESSNKNK